MSRRGRTVAAVGLAVVGGLVLAGAGAGDWVRQPVERSVGGVGVGGVGVSDVEAVGGMTLAPLLLPLGLAGVLLGLSLAALPARGRRVGGLLLAATGTAGLVAVGLGGWRAAGMDGTTPLPALAGLAAVGLIAAGALALRPAPPARLPPRFDLEADADTDDEWAMASEDDRP